MPALSGARVLVTGASGQLGTAIVARFRDLDLVPRTHAELDLGDSAAVSRAIDTLAPDIIINCAALNDVDGAEDRPLDALAVNAFGVRALARAAEHRGATLVHYSTDFVFDGEATTPYTEDSPTSPRSTYAASKLLGEWFALEAPRAYVLRVESLFGTARDWVGRRGSLAHIVDGLEQGRDVRVFIDRVVSPSYIVDIAAATRFLLDESAPAGLYHCVNGGCGTWHEVATEAARMLGVTPRLVGVTLEQMTMKAARPRYCALDNTRLAKAGFRMPAWQDALRRWLAVRGVAGTVQ